MEQRNKRTIAILMSVLAVIAVAILLVGLFLASSKKEQPLITLPPAVENQPSEKPSEPVREDEFLRVTTQNVLQIVEHLSRPEAYHQTYVVSLMNNDEQHPIHVELWVNGDLLRGVVSNQYDTRYILSNHEEAYIWYSDAEKPRKVTISSDLTTDDLLGLPTYETLLLTPKENVLDADYLILDNPTSRSIYVCVKNESGDTCRYWIDLDTGLVSVADVLESSQQVYTVRQETMEILASEDEAFRTCFQLPNGTDPFTD